MKRAFTLIEILVVMSVLVLAGSLAYPVFANVKKMAHRTTCISNFKQIGMAFALYRETEDGAEQGSPSQMGFPPEPGPILLTTDGRRRFECRGNNPDGNAYSMNYPQPHDPTASQQQWVRYVSFVGPAAILLFDENHQSSFPRSLRWENWTVIGLRLDSSVVVRTHLGFPLHHGWWHE